MPAVRTAKKVTAWSIQDLVANRPKKTPLLGKGAQSVRFGSSKRDWTGNYQKAIGTSTRSITFGGEFVLTDDHINNILALGSQVCENIEQFVFTYSDVGYDAQNTAESLTNKAVIQLAKACPKLKKFQLPGTQHVNDDALVALFESCSGLTSVELTDTTGGRFGQDKFSGSALDRLREHPEWAPKLKTLILSGEEADKSFMKAVRALGKERPALTITLLQRREDKKYGDWEIVVVKKNFKKGRAVSRW